MAWIMAQSPVDAVNGLAGLSGWAGAGLLGAVLAWLMFVHLPSIFKQHAADLAAKDTLIVKLVDDFKGVLKQERDSHDAMMKEQREAATASETRLADLLLSNTSETRLLSAAVTNLAQQAGLMAHGIGKM